mmetsp:Transcript_40575/g.75540  ORF Transcript_40575/g.75540 Transcript_40575/m.75540 type:complete len:357 (+) Transcript_40575:100-1170(+)
MGESHAYGASLFCISRRYFVIWFCIIFIAVCAARSLEWITATSLNFEGPVDLQKQAADSQCQGTACYEVFTCFGMKDTTVHIMEPLMTLSGLLFYPLGLHAAHHGHDLEMKRFGLYLLASCLVRIGVLIFDVAYMNVCDAYSTNMMTLVLSELLPPSPLRVGIQDNLRGRAVFPIQVVDDATNHFHLTTWYLSLTGALILLFVYATVEVMALSGLMQYGLLGLGVHFGLDQWDEALNHASIRRKVQREIRSKFVDDAQLPFVHDPIAAGQGPSYEGHQSQGFSYGSAYSHEPLLQGKARAMSSTTEFNSTMESQRFYSEASDFDSFEDEAEAVRALAEKLANEESPEALLDRTIFE